MTATGRVWRMNARQDPHQNVLVQMIYNEEQVTR
jgi:hypothetical protein